MLSYAIGSMTCIARAPLEDSTNCVTPTIASGMTVPGTSAQEGVAYQLLSGSPNFPTSDATIDIIGHATPNSFAR